MAQPLTLPPLVRGEWLPMTSEEFDEWVPDGMQAEWVDGKGMIFVSTGTWHGMLVAFTLELLRRYCALFDLGQVFLGPVELRLPSGQRREPDVFVILAPDLDRVHPKWVDGPAALAIEFVSEFSVQNDLVDKMRAYEEAGVREYLKVFTVDRVREPEFHRLGRGGDYERVWADDLGRLRSMVLPGFWFDMAWFRGNELPNPDAVLMKIAPEAYTSYLLEMINQR